MATEYNPHTPVMSSNAITIYERMDYDPRATEIARLRAELAAATARAESSERWSLRYKRMLRAYRWCSNYDYDDIRRFDKIVQYERRQRATEDAP